MTNLTIVYPVKMEYGWNFSTCVNSGQKGDFLKRTFIQHFHSCFLVFSYHDHHLKAKFGMYFAQPSYCIFEWCRSVINKKSNTEMRTKLCEIWENWQRVTNTGTSTMLEAHHPNLEVHFSLDSSPKQGRRNRRGAVGWSPPHLFVNQLTLLQPWGGGRLCPPQNYLCLSPGIFKPYLRHCKMPANVRAWEMDNVIIL